MGKASWRTAWLWVSQVKNGVGWAKGKHEQRPREWNSAASGKIAIICYGWGVQTKEWDEVWEKAKEKCGKQFITEDLEFEGEQMGIILNNMAEIV